MSTRRRNMSEDDKKWDDIDDRLHDVHQRDEPDFSLPTWRSIRRGRTLPIVATLVLLYLIWTNWPRSSSSLNWKRHAYVQYAVDEHNLCNALMVFESLHRHGSKAQRVLLHDPEWATEHMGGKDRKARLLTLAEKKYKVKLHAVHPLDSRGDRSRPSPSHSTDDGQPSTWDTSITKLRAFDLTSYTRVLVLDSDITLRAHLDSLFTLPSTPIALPRAYWSHDNPKPLTTFLMLLEPNALELPRLLNTLQAWRMNPAALNLTGNYDMDIINHRFASSAHIIPHRPFAMLSAEFRQSDHSAYMGTVGVENPSARETWDADREFREAKVVHFSDWPLPKPWFMWPEEGLQEVQPDCGGRRLGCREREIWKGLYEDFRARREKVCKMLPVRAPAWAQWKGAVGWEG